MQTKLRTAAVTAVTAGLAFAAPIALPPATAHAQVSISFLHDSQTGILGSTLTYTGTLTNTGSNTVTIGGDNPFLAVPGLTLDDSPFLANAPATLTAGGSSGTFDMFTVTIDPSTTPGSYQGVFEVVDPGSNVLGSQTFEVVVASPNGAAPEPGSAALLLPLAIGLYGLAAYERRHRRNGMESTQRR